MLTGTLKKVTGYTGFNESETSEQSGYYLPFLYNGGQEAKMYVKSSTKQVVIDKAPTVNVVFLGATKATAQKAILSIVVGDQTTKVNMNGITFE